MSPTPKIGAAKIVFRDVGKRFESAGGESVHALASVSVDIATGEFVTIVGPSGCGKSTLLNILAGFDEPSQGEVLIDGHPIKGPSAERGVVFQEYALFPWLSVAGNVAFGPGSRGLSAHETAARVRDCIAMVKLEGFERKYPHELSGGMRQRCALARCIANDPDVMLMDEPLAALDALTRLSLQEELLRIWSETSRARPKTVLFITHSIDEALYLSDRILVMSDRPGRILREIRVPFPRPRPPEIRTDPEFHRLSDEIWLLLRKDP